MLWFFYGGAIVRLPFRDVTVKITVAEYWGGTP